MSQESTSENHASTTGSSGENPASIISAPSYQISPRKNSIFQSQMNGRNGSKDLSVFAQRLASTKVTAKVK